MDNKVSVLENVSNGLKSVPEFQQFIREWFPLIQSVADIFNFLAGLLIAYPLFRYWLVGKKHIHTFVNRFFQICRIQNNIPQPPNQIPVINQGHVLITTGRLVRHAPRRHYITIVMLALQVPFTVKIGVT